MGSWARRRADRAAHAGARGALVDLRVPLANGVAWFKACAPVQAACPICARRPCRIGTTISSGFSLADRLTRWAPTPPRR